MKINKFWLNLKKFCDGDCNNCEVLHNRQLSVILNALRLVYGDGVYEIVQSYCPNLTCCADCHIDDFCHDEECQLLTEAEQCAKVVSGKDDEANIVDYDPQTGQITLPPDKPE